MSKGLEALKQFRNRQQGVNVYADELLDIIEKELKALEIIKEKVLVVPFLILHLELDNLKEYNKIMDKKHKLTQEEFDLLTEVSL